MTRIRIGTNFKSSDVREVEFIGGTNVSISGVETAAAEAQVTISATGGSGGTGLVVVPTVIKTANYTAVGGDYVPVSTAFNPVTITLPTAPADGTVIGVKLVTQVAGNAVTVTVGGGTDVFNTVLGPTSISLTLLNQDVIVQYDAAFAIWFAIVDDYTIPAIDTLAPASDITTLNATAAKHGLLPKLSNVITQFFNGQSGWSVPVLDQLAAPSDITTLNATTSAHGLLRKLDGVATHYLDGTGALTVPPGSSGTIGQVTSTGGTISITGATGPVVNIEAPASQSRNPWSTVLNANVTAGANTLTLTDELPAAKLIAGGSGLYAYFVIDAWTTNAEFYLAAVDGTGKGLGFASGMAHNHSAGASVLLVEDLGINAAWWGTIGNGGNPTTNATALNALFTQLNSASNNPLGIGWSVTGVGCQVSAPVVCGSRGVGAVNGFGLTATSDFGAGTAVFECASVPSVTNCSVSCSVTPPAFSTFVSGGSHPWVLMDGFSVSSRQVIQNCGATNVRAGFYMAFFDHASMKDTLVKACFYGYYFQGSTNAGDASFTRVYADGTYRSTWGFGPGCNQSQGSSYYNCSWVNTPFIRYFEGDGRGAANGCVPIQLVHDTCNVEFLGNCYYYAEPGSGRTSLWEVWLGNNNTLSGASSSGFRDSNYPATAAIINNSGTTMFIQACEWTIGPGGYVFDSPSGNIAFTGPSKFTTNAQGAPTAICNTGCSPSLNPRLVIGAASGPAAAPVIGTLNPGDLTEVSGTMWQRYQTVGAPATGVVGMTPTGGVAAIFDQGEMTVNCGTNTIAAGKYVKADLSGLSYRALVMSLSPAAFYMFSEQASGLAATDQTGNANGVYAAAPTLGVAGLTGGGGLTAAKFAVASNQYVSVGNNAALHLGDTLTYEIWLKLSTTGVAYYLFSDAAGTSVVMAIDSTGHIQIAKAGGSSIVASTSAITDTTTFHHIVYTKATSTNHLYVDATDVTGSVTNATLGNSNGIYIGRSSGGTYLDGTLAMAAIYPTALSSGAVSANYAAGTATVTSTLGHVIQASGYTDGPIVGRSLAASASNTVLIKL